MGEFVRVEVADGIATIRLDRPKMNALSAQVQEEIADAAAQVAADSAVRAAILYGGERVFAAGADIKEMASLGCQEMAERSAALQAALSAVADLPKPVVAAVTGYALGGGLNSRSAPISGCWARAPRSASRRSCSGSSPGRAARSGCRG